METDEKFTVVRELYPEEKGSFFKRKRCPKVDDSRELAFGMNASGDVVRLEDEKARDAAARGRCRIFAVSKRQVRFSDLILHVCRCDGYEWNYAIEGVVKMSDYAKFLNGWARDEGSCGLEGISFETLAHRVTTLLEDAVRGAIGECRASYTVAEIQEKDVLPLSAWEHVFKGIQNPLLEGLGVELVDAVFVSPDLELEQRIHAADAAAAAARRELEEKAKEEFQGVVNGKMADAELAELERQRIRAEKDFELEMAKRDAEIRKCQMESQQFNLANLQRARDDIAAAIQQAAKGDSDLLHKQMEAMSEVTSKMAAIADRLAELGAKSGTPVDSCSRIDPAVAPRYQGMSDGFREVMELIRSKARNAVTLTYQVRDARVGYATRAIISDVYTATRTLGSIGGTAPTRTGSLRIGDGITIRLKSDRSGYLTLFNFGTSPGVVHKIFPDPTYGAQTRHIEAGRHYIMPGDLIPCPPGCEFWPVGGATTAEYGLKERVLAIVTDDPVDIDVDGFKSKVGAVVTRGGFASVEETITSFLDLPDGSWSWGLVEAKVEG